MIGSRLRAGIAGGLARVRRPRPSVLMYHRIADLESDPWGLAVSPANFGSQLAFLARHRRIIPLDRLARDAIDGRLPPDAIAISFDDGYSDNLHAALPLLERFEAPGTFFITTDPIGSGRAFWWDELTTLILEQQEPIDCVLRTLPATGRVQFGAIEPGDRDPCWRALRSPARTARQRTYLLLWEALRAEGDHTRDHVLAELATFAPGRDTPSAYPLERAELKRLAGYPLADIGGHTASHPDLRTLTPGQQSEEMTCGKTRLEQWCGRAITGFAYPHGLYDETSKVLAAQAGFAWACTTRGSSLPPMPDRYAIPRLTIGNVDALGLQRVLARY